MEPIKIMIWRSLNFFSKFSVSKQNEIRIIFIRYLSWDFKYERPGLVRIHARERTDIDPVCPSLDPGVKLELGIGKTKKIGFFSLGFEPGFLVNGYLR